jgi:hypothetical protein
MQVFMCISKHMYADKYRHVYTYICMYASSSYTTFKELCTPFNRNTFWQKYEKRELAQMWKLQTSYILQYLSLLTILYLF